MSSPGEGPSSLDLVYVYTVFGSDNVAKLLAVLETGEHRAAMEFLVGEANVRMGDVPFGGVSANSIAFLRNLLVRFRGPDAAALVEFVEDHAVHASPVFQQRPFDAAQVGDEAHQAATAAQGVELQKAAGAVQVAMDPQQTAQQLAAAEAIASFPWLQDMVDEIDAGEAAIDEIGAEEEVLGLQDIIDEFRAIAEGVTEEPHDVQAEQYGAVGLTGDQDMTMFQQLHHHDDLMIGLDLDLDFDVTLGLDLDLDLQQEEDETAAYADATDESGSGAVTMPLQPGVSADSPPFLVQQPQMPDASRPQMLPLLPSMTQNDGGDEGESSSDPGAHCSSNTPYPDAPSDDK